MDVGLVTINSECIAQCDIRQRCDIIIYEVFNAFRLGLKFYRYEDSNSG
jgi:hypothetical protein